MVAVVGPRRSGQELRHAERRVCDLRILSPLSFDRRMESGRVPLFHSSLFVRIHIHRVYAVYCNVAYRIDWNYDADRGLRREAVRMEGTNPWRSELGHYCVDLLEYIKLPADTYQ